MPADSSHDLGRGAGRGSAPSRAGAVRSGAFGATGEVGCPRSAATAFVIRTLRAISVRSRARARRRTVEALIDRARHPADLSASFSALASDADGEGCLASRATLYTSLNPLPEPASGGCLRTTRARHSPTYRFLLDYLRSLRDKLAAVLTGAESPLETLFPAARSRPPSTSTSAGRWLGTSTASCAACRSRRLTPRAGATAARPRDRRRNRGDDGGGAARAARRPRRVRLHRHVGGLPGPRARAVRRRTRSCATGSSTSSGAPPSRGSRPAASTWSSPPTCCTPRGIWTRPSRMCRSLLAPGGLLVLYETTAHPGWFDVTIGLIEGWQRFDDERATRQSAAGPAEWTEALACRRLRGGRVLSRRQARRPSSDRQRRARSARAPVAAQAGTARGAGVPRRVRNGVAPSTQPDARPTISSGRSPRPRGDERHERRSSSTWQARSRRVLRSPAREPPDPRHRLMDLGFDSLDGGRVARTAWRGPGADRRFRPP